MKDLLNNIGKEYKNKSLVLAKVQEIIFKPDFYSENSKVINKKRKELSSMEKISGKQRKIKWESVSNKDIEKLMFLSEGGLTEESFLHIVNSNSNKNYTINDFVLEYEDISSAKLKMCIEELSNKRDVIEHVLTMHAYTGYSQISWLDNFSEDTRRYGYIASYLKTGHILTKHYTIEDEMVYAIMFNYRHYLELLLKHIIWSNIVEEALKNNHEKVDIDKYINHKIDESGINNTHNLSHLWEKVEIILKRNIEDKDERCRNVTLDTIKSIKEIVLWFHRYDKSSQSFRYSYGKSGDELLDSEFSVNFNNLRNMMNYIDISLQSYYY